MIKEGLLTFVLVWHNYTNWRKQKDIFFGKICIKASLEIEKTQEVCCSHSQNIFFYWNRDFSHCGRSAFLSWEKPCRKLWNDSTPWKLTLAIPLMSEVMDKFKIFFQNLLKPPASKAYLMTKINDSNQGD